MVNFGTESHKDELINEMADMLERMLHGEIGCGPKNVSENDVHQLIKKAKGIQSSDQTIRHIGDLINGR